MRSILSSLASIQYSFWALWSIANPFGVLISVVTMLLTSKPKRKDVWIESLSVFQLVQKMCLKYNPHYDLIQCGYTSWPPSLTTSHYINKEENTHTHITELAGISCINVTISKILQLNNTAKNVANQTQYLVNKSQVQGF